MSDYQCQICTGTRGWHTSGCKQVSQELAALQRELEQERKRLNAVVRHYWTVELDPDEPGMDLYNVYIAGSLKPLLEYPCSDPREAIDNAITQAEGGGDE